MEAANLEAKLAEAEQPGIITRHPKALNEKPLACQRPRPEDHGLS